VEIPRSEKKLCLSLATTMAEASKANKNRGNDETVDYNSAVFCQSALPLVNEVDSFPYPYPSLSAYVEKVNSYFHFRVAGLTIGYMLPSIAITFLHHPDWKLDTESMPRTLTLVTGTDEPSRTVVMGKTIDAMRQTGHFKALQGWRDELYAVYSPNIRGSALFLLERSAAHLFGVVTYGVHMTAYCIDPNRKYLDAYQIWVPRRSMTKQTFPGMLDNTVAGGLGAYEDRDQCLIRESMEEASLPEEIAMEAKTAGAVTYFNIADGRSGSEIGLLQPECQFVYDLDLTDKDVDLKPGDSEVEDFEVMNGSHVWAKLLAGEFKPNSALVLIDFLIRHDIYPGTPDPTYSEVVARLHRRLEFHMCTG
jgi:isopentenyldiphosphate isomerase